MARRAQGPRVHPSLPALGVAAFFLLLSAAPAFGADTTAPTLAVYAPLEGAQLVDDRPIVFGATERGATVTVNGVQANVNLFDGTFEVRDLTLAATGQACLHTAVITVVSTDAAGNAATVTRTVTANQCSTHPRLGAPLPDLTIALGQGGAVAYDLTQYFADDGGSDALIFSTHVSGDGIAASYSQGALSFSFAPSAAPGTFDLAVTAHDRAGESSDAAHIRLFVEDAAAPNRAPQITIRPALNPVPVGGTSVIYLTVVDPDLDTFTVQAGALSVGLSIRWVEYGDAMSPMILVAADASALDAGPGRVRVTAVDERLAVSSIEVPVDVYDASVSPALTLVVPTVPEVVVSDLVSFNGETGVWVDFTSERYVARILDSDPAAPAVGPEASARNDERTYWSVFVELPTVPGTYTRHLWAWDQGLPDRVFTFTWTVRADPVAPALVEIQPITGSLSLAEGERVSLQWVGDVPDLDATTFTWAVDGETVGHAPILEDLALAPGTHEVTVTAVAPGGSGSTSTTITVSPGAVSLPPGRSNLWLWGIGLAGLVVVGIILGGTEIGIYFLMAGLVGAVIDRQSREKLLTHFVRGRIYQIIEFEPGIHLSELQRKAGVARGVCAYHLHALEKAGLIKTAREGMYLRFFATKVKIDAEAYTLAADDRAVLEAIEAQPGITEQQVAALLGKSNLHVTRCVRALSQSGYVELRREGEDLQLFARTNRGQPAAGAQ